MKLSTKGRYGLRAVIDLAVHARDGHVSIQSVAERQDMSVSYLEHLFSQLKKARIIRSVKGSQGGYSLAYPADRMCVGDVLRALEGEFNLIEPNAERSLDEDILNRCIQANVWDMVNKKLNVLLDGIALEELAEDQRMREGISSPMYYI
jgi:Rrf2 family cysteine metabolism transcriptional repressor